jgi:hypothetical protein
VDRRGFVRSLIVAGLAASVDTDRLLWTPGERRIFVPRFTEFQRAQWLMFLDNRDGWLRWFAVDPLKPEAMTWPPEFEAEIRQKIAIGNARAKELGLDERLHRFS